MALTPGTSLGPYEIQSPLGSGGMGEVYKARDTRLDRTVAVKVLPQHVAADPALKQRFEREARTVAALNHPHICTIHDVGQQDGIDFLVMEYLQGETLASRLTKGALPLDRALNYASEIGDAVDKAHRHGVVHRDLKPGNIMLTPSGAKLLDFGLAKLRQLPAVASLSMLPTQESPVTAQGTILGTLPYMAPEQLEGKEADARTDLFAFGAVLYEMITGRRAFGSKSQASLIAAIIDRDPPPISSVAPVSPPGLDWIVRRCLAKDPEDRWQTARDLLAELRRTAEGDFQLAASSLAVAPARRRAPVVAALAAASVLALIVAGLVGWNLRPSASAQVTRFAVIPPAAPAGAAFLVDPNVSSLSSQAVSRDGTRVAIVADGRLYLRNLNEMELKPAGTPGFEPPATEPVFSPDGKWLLYVEGPNPGPQTYALMKRSLTGGNPVRVAGPSRQPQLDVVWETGETILYADTGGIVRVDANGGTPEIIVKARDGEALGCPRILPGGTWVMFCSTKATQPERWDSAEILAQSIDSGERRQIWKGGSDARYLRSGHIVYAQRDALFAFPFDVSELRVTGTPVPIIAGVRRPSQGMSGTADFSVSDTGTLAYVPARAQRAIPLGALALVDMNGRVTKLDVPPDQFHGPQLSPDGRQMAVEIVPSDGLSDVWVYSMSGDSAPRQLTQGGNSGHPIWTRDSTRITFASTRDGPSAIYWQRADGTDIPERLTAAEGGERVVPESWSKDGRTLSFSKGNTAWTLSLDKGAKPVMLVGDKERGAGAVFSPDGRWLAYRENRRAGRPGEANEQIYIEPFPATGKWHRVSKIGGASPLWSRDGRRLFYRSGIEGMLTQGSRLIVIEFIALEPAPRWNERVLPIKSFLVAPLYRDYDVTPDGRLLMIVPAGTTESGDAQRPQISVVLNWFEELKRLVPTK